MSHFEEALTRLKRGLGVKHDQEAADFLGLTKWALSARKTRGGAFPEDLLRQAVEQHPEVNVNIDWVLTGADQPVDRDLAVNIVQGQRGAHAPPLNMAFLVKVLERVEKIAADRGVELDASALGDIAGAVYNVTPVGSALNDALIHAMLQLRVSAAHEHPK
ncbi:MAG TPA: helix-turn-helix domain-containing protein [Roseateles sp.]